jgi:hypothetical protein
VTNLALTGWGCYNMLLKHYRSVKIFLTVGTLTYQVTNQMFKNTHTHTYIYTHIVDLYLYIYIYILYCRYIYNCARIYIYIVDLSLCSDKSLHCAHNAVHSEVHKTCRSIYICKNFSIFFQKTF